MFKFLKKGKTEDISAPLVSKVDPVQKTTDIGLNDADDIPIPLPPKDSGSKAEMPPQSRSVQAVKPALTPNMRDATKEEVKSPIKKESAKPVLKSERPENVAVRKELPSEDKHPLPELNQENKEENFAELWSRQKETHHDDSGWDAKIEETVEAESFAKPLSFQHFKTENLHEPKSFGKNQGTPIDSLPSKVSEEDLPAEINPGDIMELTGTHDNSDDDAISSDIRFDSYRHNPKPLDFETSAQMSAEDRQPVRKAEHFQPADSLQTPKAAKEHEQDSRETIEEDFSLPDFEDVEETKIVPLKPLPEENQEGVFIRAYDYLRLMSEKKQIISALARHFQSIDELAKVLDDEESILEDWYDSLNVCQTKLIEIDQSVFE